jgi:periplasmic protein TonB
MYDTGYLATTTRRPAVMAGTIAIHVAGLAALLLIAPQVTQYVDPGMEVKHIPLPTDPPLIPKDDKRIIKTAPHDDHITTKTTLVPSKSTDDGFTSDPGPLTGIGSGGDVTGIVEFPPIDPPKDPVIVGPRFSGRNAQPPYPPGLQRLEIEGKVTVRVLVGIDGRPVRIEAVQADNDGFFTATRDWGMKHWRFTPATRDGVPFQDWRTMTVRFDMN